MSFVDLEKPISTSSYYRVVRKLRYEAAAAFLHHQIKQIQETETENGDAGGIGTGNFSEAEEGAGMPDGQSGSGGFAQYSVHFLQRKHPSVTSQPQIHHRGSLSPPQSRVSSSLPHRPASKLYNKTPNPPIHLFPGNLN